MLVSSLDQMFDYPRLSKVVVNQLFCSETSKVSPADVVNSIFESKEEEGLKALFRKCVIASGNFMTSNHYIIKTGKKSYKLLSSLGIAKEFEADYTKLVINAQAAKEGSNLNQARNGDWLSEEEKNGKVKEISTLYPDIRNKVLFHALNLYKFDTDKFLAACKAGMVDFKEIDYQLTLIKATLTLEKLSTLAKELPPSSVKDLPNFDMRKFSGESQTETELTSYWDFSKSGIKLFANVELTSEEGLKVFSRFFQGCPSSDLDFFKIKKIERIQNPDLKDLFITSQQMIICDNEFKKNEQTLFHGCSSRNIQSIAAKGFDIRFARLNGSCGVGNYFAKFPRTSLGYINDCPYSEKKIILARVELGSVTTKDNLFKAYPTANRLIRTPPPKFEYPDGTFSLFDSVSADLGGDPNHPIYVVYKDYQALPEYVITFAVPTPDCLHPTYKKQLEESKKSLSFLERTVNNEQNKSNKLVHEKLVKLYELLNSDPEDPTSPHQTENWNLRGLQDLVRFFNHLISTCRIIHMPETKTLNSQSSSSSSTSLPKFSSLPPEFSFSSVLKGQNEKEKNLADEKKEEEEKKLDEKNPPFKFSFGNVPSEQEQPSSSSANFVVNPSTFSFHQVSSSSNATSSYEKTNDSASSESSLPKPKPSFRANGRRKK